MANFELSKRRDDNPTHDGSSVLLTVVVLTIVIFALCMVGLSIGMIVRGKALRGSCRGPKPIGPNGEVLTCHDCSCQEQQVVPPESIKFRHN